MLPKEKKQKKVIKKVKKPIVKRYVIGFLDQSNGACYSKDAWVLNDNSGGISLMSMEVAKKHLKEMSFDGSGDEVAVFKLVPVFEATR